MSVTFNKFAIDLNYLHYLKKSILHLTTIRVGLESVAVSGDSIRLL
jgi:hypothetical protein